MNFYDKNLKSVSLSVNDLWYHKLIILDNIVSAILDILLNIGNIGNDDTDIESLYCIKYHKIQQDLCSEYESIGMSRYLKLNSFGSNYVVRT